MAYPCHWAPVCFCTNHRAKNKAYSDSSSRGLFLTCRGENIFFLSQATRQACTWYQLHVLCLSMEKRYPLTWNDGFLRRSELPHLQAPRLESTDPFLVPLPSLTAPFFPPSHPHLWTLTTTEDINMPESSCVRHSISCEYLIVGSQSPDSGNGLAAILYQ
jgi:hypothetical protein